MFGTELLRCTHRSRKTSVVERQNRIPTHEMWYLLPPGCRVTTGTMHEDHGSRIRLLALRRAVGLIEEPDAILAAFCIGHWVTPRLCVVHIIDTGRDHHQYASRQPLRSGLHSASIKQGIVHLPLRSRHSSAPLVALTAIFALSACLPTSIASDPHPGEEATLPKPSTVAKHVG